MGYTRAVPEDEAEGAVAELYALEREAGGEVTNATRTLVVGRPIAAA